MGYGRRKRQTNDSDVDTEHGGGKPPLTGRAIAAEDAHASEEGAGFCAACWRRAGERAKQSGLNARRKERHNIAGEGDERVKVDTDE